MRVPTTGTSVNAANVKIVDRYVYDQSDRLLDSYESLQGAPEILLSHNGYNEIGQLVTKGIHSTNYNGKTGTFAQTPEYRYTIQGWLKTINNGTLTKDNGVTLSGTSSLFGVADISSYTYRNKIEKTKLTGLITGGQGYALQYDSIGRLRNSSYYNYTGTAWMKSTTGAFTEQVTGYDEMGNIQSLKRKDKSGTALNTLSYAYLNSGNRLSGVIDGGSEAATSNYTYDARYKSDTTSTGSRPVRLSTGKDRRIGNRRQYLN